MPPFMRERVKAFAITLFSHARQEIDAMADESDEAGSVIHSFTLCLVFGSAPFAFLRLEQT